MQFNMMTRQGFSFIPALSLAATLLLGTFAATDAHAASTAAQLLQQGITQYQVGNYQQAKATLGRIDPVQLDAEQRVQYNKMLEQAVHADKASTQYKAATVAESRGDLDKAKQLYMQVTADTLAPQALRENALEGLARIENGAANISPQPLEPEQPEPAPIKPQPMIDPDTGTPATGTTGTTPPVPPKDMLSQEIRLQIAQKLAEARQAMEQRQYSLAADHYEDILNNLDANDAQALAGLVQARAKSAGALPTGVLGDVQAEIELRTANAIALYNQAMSKAKTKLDAANYTEAGDAVTVAKSVVESNKQYLGDTQTRTMLDDARSLGKQIETASEQARIKEIENQNEKIAAEEAAARKRALMERDRKILDLLRRARDLVRDHKYPEALEHARQVLFIDPNNAAAQFLNDMLEDQMVNSDWDRALRDRNHNLMQARLQTVRDTIPFNEITEFPNDWPQLYRDRMFLMEGTGTDSEANTTAATKLAQAIPVDFKQNNFESVIDFMRTRTGVDIVPNWKALETAGIQRDVPVTLQMQSVPASKVLQFVLEQVGGELVQLGYTIDEGVVIIATKEFLAQKTLIRAYDIRDLVVRVPDFTEAPEFDLSAIATDDVGGTSIFNDTSTNEEPDIPRSELLIRIMDLIRNTVDPDGWRTAGGLSSSMEELNGTLIVNTTSDNHRELQALLSQLREQRALQISIDGRFLFVTQNFLEEVGVDMDIIWNGTNSWLGSPVLIGNQTNVQALREASDIPGSLGDNENFAVPGFSATGEFDDVAGVFNPLSFIVDDLQVNLMITATQADRRSISVNTPRLTFFNGQRAFVTVSRQVGFVSDLEPVGSGDSIAFDPEIDVVSDGVVLDVEGTISADRLYVTLTVRPSLAQIIEIREFTTQSIININNNDPNDPGGGDSLIGSGVIQQPELQLTTVRTTVSVPDKGTLLLGGQRLMQEIEIESGVPILSKIPIINRLFTNRATVKDERTLLILIKPTIIIQSEIMDKVYPGLRQNPGSWNSATNPMP